MSRRIAIALSILLVLPLLMAMSFGGEEDPTSIPTPTHNYKVRLTDQEGLRVELTQFSVKGLLFFTGNVGKGEAAINIDKVRHVTFTQLDGKLKAKVNLTDGQPVELVVDPKALISGKTSYGNYVIPLGEVSRIDFLGKLQ